jgi:hypothetical protein
MGPRVAALAAGTEPPAVDGHEALLDDLRGGEVDLMNLEE